MKNCSWDHLEIQAHYTMTESINKRSENFVCSGRWLRLVLYVNVAPHVRNIEIILMDIDGKGQYTFYPDNLSRFAERK